MQKIVFMGTPQFAVPVLKALVDDPEIDVQLVITQPDRPVGRKAQLTPPPVKDLAQERGLPIMQPDNVNGDDVKEMLTSANPDFIIVVAYGQLLSQEIIDCAKKEILNVHASLLPRYRGASPIQSAILSGDPETGVSIMGVRRKMDAGPVYLVKKTATDEKNFIELSKELADLGAEALVETVHGFDELSPAEQDHDSATHCKKVSRGNGEINFDEESAEDVILKYRAFYGWPGVFTSYDGKRLILSELTLGDASNTDDPGTVFEAEGVIHVASKSGSIILKRVKIEGKKEMSISDFTRGYSDFAGSKLG